MRCSKGDETMDNETCIDVFTVADGVAWFSAKGYYGSVTITCEGDYTKLGMEECPVVLRVIGTALEGDEGGNPFISGEGDSPEIMASLDQSKAFAGV
jgi:hypothetical protein